MSDLLNTTLGVLLSFLALVIVFTPMQKAFPAKKNQTFFRPNWLLDLCFFLGQYLIWNGLLIWILNNFNTGINNLMPNTFIEAVHSQNWWLQMLEVVVLSDFCIYWAHRLQHHSAFLWRFHKIHHTAEHMDWLAAHREHPLDTIYTVCIINLPAFALGFPIETIAGLIAFRGIWAIYIHSNVRLPFKPLNTIIGGPELHHWHHDKNPKAGNYANISPLMDIIFGTYTCPDHEPTEFGIDKPLKNNYIHHMLEPLTGSGTANQDTKL